MPTLFLRVRAAAALYILISCSHACAIEIFIDNAGDPLSWPTAGGVVIGADPETQFETAERASQPPHQLTQTFQVDTAFDVNSIFIRYRNKLPLGSTAGIQIFSVLDVNALSLPSSPKNPNLVPVGSTEFLNDSFSAISTLTEEEPDNGSPFIAQIVLDSPISLPATSGSAGYALRFLDAPTGEFRWYRTNSSVGNVYSGGAAFENGNARGSGLRDFGLVLSSDGPPMPPVDTFSVQSGALELGTTWDTGLPPEPGFNYNVSATHTVTVNNTSFAGRRVVVLDGGTLDLATSNANLRDIEVRAGGALVTSMSGDIGIGDINADELMGLNLGEDISLSANSGLDIFLDVELTGTGDLNVQSNGASSSLFITAARDHEGVIRFNGDGDRVEIVERDGFNVLEMNSTGENTLFYDAADETSSGTIIFNQAGKVIHASTGQRRQGADNFVANANVEVDLSTNATSNELRWRILESLSGSGDITVTGTNAAPVTTGITNNEFEVGSRGEPPTPRVNDYSGTLSGSGHVDFEIFNSLPNAKISVTSNAMVEFGHQVVEPSVSVAVGEVEVGSAGTLVVGYAEDGQHHVHNLVVTNSGSRDGDLTLSAGSTVVMQINGTAEGQFDTIVAQGDITLAGQLDLLINPTASAGTLPTYAPTLGDTFDLITVGSGPVEGDYTGDGMVDSADFDAWRDSFGSIENLAADGNGDGVVDGIDYAIWRENLGAQGTPGGSLTGTLSLNPIDPDGVLATAGLALQLSTTSTALRLEVVLASASANVAVPEPSGLAGALLAMSLVLIKGRSSRRRA